MNGQITELVTDDLPPLYIRESPVSDLLNPLAVRHSCRIVMEYAIEPGDRVSVSWAGAPGAGSYTSVFFPVGELRPLEVGIGGIPLVIFNLGRTVTLTYTVIRGDSAPVTSQPLILYVLPIALSELPRPLITQAPGFGTGLVLDVNALTEFTLRINAWPLQTQGQYFWLRLRGTNANDSVFDELYWSAPHNVVDQKFDKGFYAQGYSADPLKGLKDRSTLTLEFMAGLQGGQDPALAQRFAHRNYIISTNGPVTPVVPVIESVKGSDNIVIPDMGDTAHSRVTVTGTALAGEEVELFDGEVFLGKARAISGRWELLVAELDVRRHVFKAVALYGGNEESNAWTINVTSPLPLPLTIKEAPDNINLDLVAARDRLTAVLDYDMEALDLLRVMWVGTPGAGTRTTSPVRAGDIKPREILLPTSLVSANVGKTVTVTFSYTRGTSPPVVSQPLRLSVFNSGG
ncbi:Ig-like domain repeat protein [Pseudomonas sp. IT-P294]